MPRATARSAAYLHGRRARGSIMHCKHALTMCRVTSADRRIDHGVVSPSLEGGGALELVTARGNSFEHHMGPPRWPPYRILAFASAPRLPR
ncbi:hypothetical protein N9L68_05190 [bacterium]|nr:hypothetical protein [bacterium]